MSKKRKEIMEKAKEKYESLRKKGYTKSESLRMIASQLGKTDRTLYKWHEENGWDEIDEKIDVRHLEKLEKLPDQHRKGKSVYIVMNRLLQRAYSLIKNNGASIIIRNYYDFYGLLNAYLNLAEASENLRLESHKRFFGKAIKEVLEDPELKDKILPTRGKELEHAVKKLIEYVELAKWEEKPDTGWADHILKILKELEKMH